MAASSEGKQPVNGEPREGPEATTSSFRNFANFVDTNKGNTENASVTTHSINRGWVLDSGASKHVTGNLKEFESYIRYPPTYQETIHTADGTAQPIRGVGTVKCNHVTELSSVLYVPAFPVNLVSLIAMVDQIDCQVTINKYMCSIQERVTSRKLGTGTRHRGLWYMDHSVPGQDANQGLVAVTEDKETRALIHHCRMGHVSFDKMYQIFPDVMSGVDRSKLKCDVCEYAKHTRTSYVSKGSRSISPFVLVLLMYGHVQWYL